MRRQDGETECEDLEAIERGTTQTLACGFLHGEDSKRLKLSEGIQSALHETIVTGFDAQGTYLFIWSDPLLQQRYGVEVSSRHRWSRRGSR